MKKYVDGKYIEMTMEEIAEGERYAEMFSEEPTLEEQLADLTDLVSCLCEMVGGVVE